MPIYTVGQLALYIRESLERDPLLGEVWVSGEVSGLFHSQAGHSYFTLKEPGALLKCVMFRSYRGGDALSQNVLLASGTEVIVHGRVSFYETRGELQLYVDLVQPKGVGLEHLELELLKARLEAEGLFEPARKRPLPPFPQRIGVVTSPAGAVIHDITHVVQQRYPLVELVIAPTKVQGEGASEQIVRALEALNSLEGLDLLILARGGGSQEDLSAFNEERVARAVFGSRVPVISAVGHQVDWTIADLVADQRASTPTAAAEMAVPDRRELLERLEASQRSLIYSLSSYLQGLKEELSEQKASLLRRPPPVAALAQRLRELDRAMAYSVATLVASARGRVQGQAMALDALSPRATLDRGYAVVQRREDLALVTQRSQAGPGDELLVTVSDGEFPAVRSG